MNRVVVTAWAIFAPTISAAGAEVRDFYRIGPNTEAPAELTAETFGLTEEQVLALNQLTKGRVDFSGFYFAAKRHQDAPVKSVVKARYIGSTDSSVPPPVVTRSEPTPDPELDGQWWVDGINARAAWEMASGLGVVIADCDAGYYVDESDIAENLLYDLRHDSADVDDPLTVDDGNFVSHGTSVAAIMVGVLDGRGTSGIAYNASLVPLQNYNYDASKDDLDKEVATAKCILKALESPQVQIIVLENQTAEGSSETFAGTREAVTLAIAAGVHVISAAGNYQTELTHEAEEDTGSVIVGALSREGDMAFFSNYGSRVSIAAFGEQLYTLRGPNGAMGDFGGTSGATPQVAAAVALMIEVNPGLTPAQIRMILEATRVQSESTALVGGRLDVAAAVSLAATTPIDREQRMAQMTIRKSIVEILRQ